MQNSHRPQVKRPAIERCVATIACLLLSLPFASEAYAQSENTVSETRRPNVLFIVVDDLNDWNSLLDPSSPIDCPNLERLAARGTLFTRAYCMSAACNPSRAATLTGLRPTTSGVYGNKSDWRLAMPNRPTIMQRFQQAGYDVRGAGKIFHHHLDGAFHDDASFDQFQPMRRQKYPPSKLNGAPKYGSRNTDWGEWPQAEADSIDFHTASYAAKVLTEKPKNETDRKPLFLACGIFKPHSPFFAPSKYHETFRDIELPPQQRDDWNDLPTGAKRLMQNKKWFWRGMQSVESDRPGAFQDFIRSYAACVRFADAQIGRVLDALDAGPRKDNTIVVLWSDHGFHLGEKDHIEKFALWEKSNHIPFIVSAPGVTQPGTKCGKPVDMSALYPTLVDLCSLPAAAKEACDGESIVPLLRDANADWKTPALMTYMPGNHAVRSERWRYIRYADGSEELYDHDRDPNEWTNLAADDSLTEVLKRHRKWLPQEEAAPVPDLKAKPEPPAKPKSASAKPAGVKPNVLFLAVDDMRAWIGCMKEHSGYEGEVHTPNIDRLAKRGTLFSNAHCPSPKCAPSRAAIMTGLRPSTTGLYDNGHWWYPNLPNVVAMPAHFRDQGYRVVGAGKIFHHTAGNNPPNQWDDFSRLTFRNDPWFRSSKLNYPWSKTSPNPPGFPFSRVAGLPHENDWGSLPIANNEYDDALTADYAIRFLKEQQTRPFFLACGIFRPHLPWYAPKEFFDLYPLENVELPPTRPDDLNDVPAEGKKLANARNADLATIKRADRHKHAIQAYLASISYADYQIGRVLDALAEAEYVTEETAKNTIVVLWSDHGWHLGEKGHWHKSTLWEEATRVPLIIAGDGTESAVCSQPVSLLDLYPTLNDLCSLPAIDSHDGVSLRPLLENHNAEWERPAVIEFRRGNSAVRSKQFRYIRYNDGSEELYDHATDPNEWRNIAGQPEHTELKESLAKWIAKDWAASAPTKKAFRFAPETYQWTEKKTGKTFHGSRDAVSESHMSAPQ